MNYKRRAGILHGEHYCLSFYTQPFWEVSSSLLFFVGFLPFLFTSMRVFITGATGFIGSAVVEELLRAGHTVLGLSRNEVGAKQLRSQGAETLTGGLQDLEVLRKGTSECEAVIHLAFINNFADFAGSCAIDRAAIKAMGSVLASAGGDRVMIITSGVGVLSRGTGADEDAQPDMTNPIAAARGSSEAVCLDLAKQSVRAIVVRLPPTVHGPGHSGFLGPLVNIALQTGISGYVGDGQNRWSACHRDDVARLYRMALERAKSESVFHAVAEEGVALKDIATELGTQLNVPVESITPDRAERHFGIFNMRAKAGVTATSAKTRAQLGWSPTSLTLIEDVPVILDFIRTQIGTQI